MAADARGGSNTIKLPSGTYTLTIAGANEDASATGDLDITSNLTIKGAGSGSTIIDGNNLDRVIQVLQGKTNISGVTIRHGLANDGRRSFEQRRPGDAFVRGGRRRTAPSAATAPTAAIGTAHTAATASTVGNGTDGTAGLGGGIFNGAGSLSISNSTISANQAIGGDGGQGGDGGFGQGSWIKPVGNGQSASAARAAAAAQGPPPRRRDLQRGGCEPHAFRHE